ncbi:tight adherence protein C [Friedmanniella endophytica]|uniref:Tight adherence protein C n=1 Tax=Microlunatus kandeliicorticis TaxID=1759536 RepID=A0A7W3P4K3_9ACTN|nr:type II secretion system F family protein [Microlunatus kandeliicorticis]MBA8793006.1 tight adherence protein C [Microlunatus kandeliicorticis]
MLPVTVWIGLAACTAAVPLLVLALTARPDPVRTAALQNLQRGLVGPAASPEQQPQRPSRLAALGRAVARPAGVARLDRLLATAGRPAAWPLERLLVIKIVLPVLVLVLGGLFLLERATPLLVCAFLLMLGIAAFLPELLLHSRGQERTQQIQLELADTLDQMTIAVEAGLGFDAAMARAGENGTGPLAEELLRTLQDTRMGRSRREAFEELSRRTATADLRRFIRAVLQADAYGVSIADVLRTQADEMRLKRRQRAEEKAMKIPVKVIFPLMFCVLPVLFIVLLGPAVLDIVKAFS